ncbi:TetR/AcrR family transcriptional regulator [Brachybacterium alimentarium]|uniref:TetR family transcriptional regulator n=1 Tax=Brachybacterium alimentarium TaxID=47845 RepID=A0A2A3YG66_9MICO|nr:TetR/AcrR family transcriptional regulator [Brachybacterium alimentarium]PCC30761.1 TetR family transcriptional regulator [Brachybacterium alimentarium]PCC38085.1 TetR family transcriptional regulator [Brachybacterium alimentarium]RCS63411.1 TetR/AcrR family transcriptional regulator [Brachybacterium alimentarium]RCS84681.1 TetR/AcrR family transcriptional regulator [Brachybacterium alimentarium]
MGTAKERLLAAAARLFYADGVHATGIDTITAEAGVARKSLYNNFSSKADLVSTFIDARHEEWVGLYRARASAASTDSGRVLAVFDAYIDHANDAYAKGFRGCGLLNAASEFPAGDPARDSVRIHKEQVERLLAQGLTALTDNARARELAEHFSYLVEGSVTRAGLEGTPERLERARDFAAQMLDDL